jgi:pimeloyl-ACP methyl ester carboxylesterase
MMLPSASALKDRYNKLTHPLLIVTGDYDRIVNPRCQSHRLSKMLPASRLLVLSGVGHMVHHTDAPTIYDAMLNMDSVPPLTA